MISDRDDAQSAKINDAVERKGPKWKNILHRTEQLRLTFQDLKGKVTSKSAHLPKFLGISPNGEKNDEKDDLEKGTVRNTGSAINTHPASTPDEKKPMKSDSTGMEVATAEREKEIQAAKVEKSPEAETGIEDSPVDINPKEKETDPLAKPDIVPDQAQPSTNEQANPQNNESHVNFASSPAAVDQSTTKAPGDGTNKDSPTATATSVGAARHGPQNNQDFGTPPRAATFKGKDKLAGIPEGSQFKTEDPSRGAGSASEKLPRPEPRKPRIPLGQLDEILIKAYSLPNSLGQMPPLQLRRTLDQYFYTDLWNTYQRDTDQVVLR
jgi:hypothetical protein